MAGVANKSQSTDPHADWVAVVPCQGPEAVPTVARSLCTGINGYRVSVLQHPDTVECQPEFVVS